MVNYKNTIIYKICCKNGNVTDIYVGHTTKFNRRKNAHKTCCNNEKSRNYNSYVYRFIRMNGGWDNWAMVKLCDYPCENITQACIQERRAIYRLNATLNSITPYRSVDERKENEKLYYEINKEKKREYYQQNKEKMNDQMKEHYQQNKEKMNDQMKEHYQINKEKINEKKREYYQINKEKISEKKREKVNCPNCNKLCGKYKLPRHMKTKKCQSFNQK